MGDLRTNFTVKEIQRWLETIMNTNDAYLHVNVLSIAYKYVA